MGHGPSAFQSGMAKVCLGPTMFQVDLYLTISVALSNDMIVLNGYFPISKSKTTQTTKLEPYLMLQNQLSYEQKAGEYFLVFLQILVIALIQLVCDTIVQ